MSVNPQIEQPEPISSIKPSTKAQNCKDAIYVLRTTQQHHIQLSIMADQKAHIIIGASLVFATLSQSYFRSGEASLSIIILGITVIISTVASLLVIMPRFRSAKPSSEVSNLLFFGSFTRISQEHFSDQLEEQLKDTNTAHQLMMKDIYQLGKVLKRKYAFLRFSYMTLTIGFLSAASHFFYLLLTTYL